MDRYQKWLKSSIIDENTKEELLNIKSNNKEIEDRFYTELIFGTGGLRGVVGAGTNRINTYMVRKTTQGLANYLKYNKKYSKFNKVVIAYDSRHYSKTFALEAALVLASNQELLLPQVIILLNTMDIRFMVMMVDKLP